MAKKRGGTEKKLCRDGYHGRLRLEGGKWGPWRTLGTDDPVLAQEKLSAWARSGIEPLGKGRELFRAAAERLLAGRFACDKGVLERRFRLRAFAYPVIGHIAVGDLEPANVHSVLSSVDATRDGIAREVERRGAHVVGAERGLEPRTLSRWASERGGDVGYRLDQVAHLRTDISRVLGVLVHEEGELSVNVARDVPIPEKFGIDERPRMSLTDEEYLRFQKRGFAGEVEMIALLSRGFAGGRPSDWFDWRYEDIDFDTWTAFVRRPKVMPGGTIARRRRGRVRRATLVYERTPMEVPEALRAPLLAWRERMGNPRTGLVFPVQKGARAGDKKKRGHSLAQRFRDLVWQERIHRWMHWLPGFAEAVGDERKKFDQLQVDTAETRALDFYSHRRQFVSAMRRAGVDDRTARLAAGHSSEVVAQGYLVADVVRLPDAVLPGGAPVSAPLPPPAPPAHGGVTPDALLAALGQLLAGALQPQVRETIQNVPQNRTASGPNVGQFDPEALDIIGCAQVGSNHRQSAPEAYHPLSRASENARLDSAERALESAREPVLSHAVGQLLSLDSARKKRR